MTQEEWEKITPEALAEATFGADRLKVLKAFSLHDPELSWDWIAGQLRTIAKGYLRRATPKKDISTCQLVRAAIMEVLEVTAATEALTLNQAKGIVAAMALVDADVKRGQGDLRPLIRFISCRNPDDLLELLS